MTGELKQAFELGELFTAQVEKPDDREYLQIIYGNQALILQAWGRLDEAMKLHKQKELICIELGNKDSLQKSYSNQAVILQTWGRLDEVMELLKKKETICIEVGLKQSLKSVTRIKSFFTNKRNNLKKLKLSGRGSPYWKTPLSLSTFTIPSPSSHKIRV